eukprot:814342-Pelagomonas_calceolata.AAC.1
MAAKTLRVAILGIKVPVSEELGCKSFPHTRLSDRCASEHCRMHASVGPMLPEKLGLHVIDEKRLDATMSACKCWQKAKPQQ